MRNLEGYQAGIHHSPLKFTSHRRWASHRRCQGFLVIRCTRSVSSYFHESHRLFVQGIVTSSGEQGEQQILKRSLCFSQSGVCRVGGKELDVRYLDVGDNWCILHIAAWHWGVLLMLNYILHVFVENAEDTVCLWLAHLQPCLMRPLPLP